MITEMNIGIDYHQESLQVCAMERDGKVIFNRRIKNDVNAIIEVVGKRSCKVVAVAEACNGSAAFLDELQAKAGWQVKLCHPGYAQRMRSNPDKSDKSDSELVADLTRVGYLPEVWLAPAAVRDLRALVRYRAQKMEEQRAVKLRIRSLLRNNRICLPVKLSLWTKAGISWLESNAELPSHSAWVLSRHVIELSHLQAEIKITTQRIKSYVDEDSLCQKLLQHKGIGVITAAVMRAEIGTFSRFKNGKQLARFCGVSPCNRSSGEIVSDSGLIRSGNPLLKLCIIQGALSLVRYDDTYKTFAQTMLARGKPKCVVIAAVANRWMRRLFHLVQQ